MTDRVFISLITPIIMASTSALSVATPGKSLRWTADTTGEAVLISNNTKKGDKPNGETKKGDEPNGEKGGTVPPS